MNLQITGLIMRLRMLNEFANHNLELEVRLYDRTSAMDGLFGACIMHSAICNWSSSATIYKQYATLFNQKTYAQSRWVVHIQ